jgi:hypothetical protein
LKQYATRKHGMAALFQGREGTVCMLMHPNIMAAKFPQIQEGEEIATWLGPPDVPMAVTDATERLDRGQLELD